MTFHDFEGFLPLFLCLFIKGIFISEQSDIYAQFYRKIHCLTSEFHVKFHAKNRYRTNRFAIRATSVFQVKFNVEFTRQAVNFS